MKITLATVLVSLCLSTAIHAAYAQGATPPAAPVAVQTLAQAKAPADTVCLAVVAYDEVPAMTPEQAGEYASSNALTFPS